MSKFGGGSSSSNDKLIKQQRREAARAEAKEKARQARLEAGRAKIQAMFGLGGGAEGGIGDDFYSGFKKSILDYYTPEVENQFSEAQDMNLYDLARRGMLKSSVAADNAAELARERAEADTQIRANAENQTAGLRGDVARAQQTALSLLQQTEDPTAAANAASTEVNAIQSRAPQFSPLGDLFSAAARSFAGWQNAQNQRKMLGGIPTRNPYTSAGKNIG